MRVRKKKKHTRLKAFIIILLVLLLMLLFIIEKLIKGKTKEIANVKSEVYAEEIINNSVCECLDECYNYEFVKKSYSDDKIVSIEVKSDEVNSFKNRLSETLNQKLNESKNQSCEINLGAVFSSNILSRIGPAINIYFQKEGSIDLDITSDFSASGINQTVHRLYLTVNLDVLALTPSGNFQFPYSTEYILSETIIVGDTPQTYVGVSKEEKNT